MSKKTGRAEIPAAVKRPVRPGRRNLEIFPFLGYNNLRFLYPFSTLKRPCQESLPSSLFQREESFGDLDGEFLQLLPPLKKGKL
jgi:hypothetical protein